MHVILGSKNYLCQHCEAPFFFSESTIDAGLILTFFGIVLLLLTFSFDSFVTDNSGVGIFEMLGYVFSLMILTFGLVFIHLSR